MSVIPTSKTVDAEKPLKVSPQLWDWQTVFHHVSGAAGNLQTSREVVNKETQTSGWNVVMSRWRTFLTLPAFFAATYLLLMIMYSLDDENMHAPGGQGRLEYVMSGNGFRRLLEEQKGYMKRLPQCIIIGVRKCGTRALIEFLNMHPQIIAAAPEVHFFDDVNNYQNGLEWYWQNMPYSRPDQVTLEKSPAYFITQEVPERIYKMNNSVRLIVIFRDPTTRVISDYTQVYFHRLAKNKTFDKFENIVIDRETGKVNMRYKAVRISVYHHHLARWLEIFRPHQIHVVDGDKLIIDPIPEVRKVERFLGVKPHINQSNLFYNETRGFYCMNNGTNKWCLGSSKGRKHPNINKKVIHQLENFFRPHNKRLFRLMGQELDWP